jgi:glycosyltransferase involved in cell wall biosynthesis
MPRPIRTLLFSTLFPSSARPLHGVFVETRLRELLKTGEVQTRVVAPVPWFPLSGRRFGNYGLFASTPRFEVRNDIEVHHPRYVLPPRMGMNIAPFVMAAAALPTVRRLVRDGYDFDLLDAHYYYPDGVAAGLIARKLGKPLAVTARGTDLNLLPDYVGPRWMILRTASQAAGSIGVSRALMDRLAAMGANPAKLHVLRNGVDLQRFVPEAREEARSRLRLGKGTLLLSVGALIELKGHQVAIEALASLHDVQLLIVGQGPDAAALQSHAQRHRVVDRVRFVGQVANEDLRWWYSAADALVLCSSREGWANVLLESMACGTPVIATDICGTPEVVAKPEAGCLMRERSAAALIEAFRELQARMPHRQAVRRYAENFSWEATTQGQIDLFRRWLT